MPRIEHVTLYLQSRCSMAEPWSLPLSVPPASTMQTGHFPPVTWIQQNVSIGRRIFTCETRKSYSIAGSHVKMKIYILKPNNCSWRAAKPLVGTGSHSPSGPMTGREKLQPPPPLCHKFLPEVRKGSSRTKARATTLCHFWFPSSQKWCNTTCAAATPLLPAYNPPASFQALPWQPFQLSSTLAGEKHRGKHWGGGPLWTSLGLQRECHDGG